MFFGELPPHRMGLESGVPRHDGYKATHCTRKSVGCRHIDGLGSGYPSHQRDIPMILSLKPASPRGVRLGLTNVLVLNRFRKRSSLWDQPTRLTALPPQVQVGYTQTFRR